MCHNCGAELLKLEEKNRQKNENSLKFDTGGTIWSCKFCGDKQRGESIKRDSLTPFTTLMISPTTSLSSSDSFGSNSSKVLSCYCINIYWLNQMFILDSADVA
jgi:1-phosphatidylinositol-3-phosphate 5-kinase